MTSNQKYELYAIEWEEHERGWGVRPDGWSFHITKEEGLKFIQDFYAKQPKDHVPDEYSCPTNENPKLVEVSKDLYDLISVVNSRWMVPNSLEKYKTIQLPKELEEVRELLDKKSLEEEIKEVQKPIRIKI